MKRFPLYQQIGLAMVLGGGTGIALNLGVTYEQVDPDTSAMVAAVGQWMGKVFLTLLNMVVVPLIFASLVSSITSVGKGGGNLRRLGFQTIAYYMLTSALAIITGLVLVNLIRPGEGMDYNALMAAAQADGATPPAPPAVAEGGVGAVLADIVYRLIPTNVVQVATSNRTILGLIFFAVSFGVAAVHTGGEHLERISGFFTAVYETMITLTNGILMVAPFGIGGYLLFVTASTGVDLMWGLVWYMVTVFLALCVHALTLSLLLFLVTQRNPIAYAATMKEALITAFSTASSSGTLPLTMQCVRKGGTSERVTSFTLPLGATLNMDGTALYEAVAVLFVAQMLGDLDLGQQVVVAVTALLASVGAAGIPHAGTVMMVIVMQAVGLPTESVLVILAVDRVLDMCRTTVNVWSDAIGAAIIGAVEEVS